MRGYMMGSFLQNFTASLVSIKLDFFGKFGTGHKPKMVRVGTACMARNTQRIELFLMFEKTALQSNKRT